jgi:hypothetical protein
MLGQCDQIGRIFAHWAIANIGQINWKLQKLLFMGEATYICINFDTKNGLGFILGDFSQTHLVTLCLGHLDDH